MTAEPVGPERLARIEQLITELVQTAPRADAAVVDELVGLLERVGSPLARAIARVLALVAEQRIAPGVALPPLAMACATLAGGVRGALGERALEAARFEIETLLPVPARAPAIDPTGAAPRPAGRAVGVPTPRDPASPVAAPDVPVSALLSRGRRSRT